MRSNIKFLLTILLVINALFFPHLSFAEGKVVIHIWPKSNATALTAGTKLELFNQVENYLIKQLQQGLQERDLIVDIVDSEQVTTKDIIHYLLIVKVENVNLGFRGPFGRISTVKASCVLQKSNNPELISSHYEETSHKSWKNCTKKISEQIAQHIAVAIQNTIVESNKPTNITVQSKQDLPEKTVDSRLQQLENLKSRGLITSEEYEVKRKEIINEL